jgi:hypothetical protein
MGSYYVHFSHNVKMQNIKAILMLFQPPTKNNIKYFFTEPQKVMLNIEAN